MFARRLTSAGKLLNLFQKPQLSSNILPNYSNNILKTNVHSYGSEISQIYEYMAPGSLDQLKSATKRWNRVPSISNNVKKSIIENLKWENPTEIQRKVFSLALKDRSVRINQKYIKIFDYLLFF